MVIVLHWHKWLVRQFVKHVGYDDVEVIVENGLPKVAYVRGGLLTIYIVER